MEYVWCKIQLRKGNFIFTVIFLLGQAVLELSKEKPSVKQAETYSTTFLKTLENVESGLSKHISYLTQVSTGIFFFDLAFVKFKSKEIVFKLTFFIF